MYYEGKDKTCNFLKKKFPTGIATAATYCNSD
jgi:hypothetical protein